MAKERLMPRQVDQDERRRLIAAAVVRLVSSRGAEAASLRAVAAEAGVSMGAVQHYFTSTDEMLLFALEYGNGLFATRIQALLAEGGPLAPRAAFRLFCTLLLPLDRDGRTGARLWAALIARGCVDEPTGRLAADAYANLTALVARSLAESAGVLASGIDIDQAARQLVTVIEGLRWPVLFGVFGEHEALAVLDSELDQIFGSR
jgi:TetR/AcrR family transcriptional regulator, transcriptional repressor of bet genes